MSINIESKVPDYAQAIAGARAWTLAPNWGAAKLCGHLWSVSMNHFWKDGEEEVAKCDWGHPAPAKSCSCGVYAGYDPAALRRLGYNPRDHRSVSGVVAGARRVFRGGDYWVAERVVVLALFMDKYPSPIKEVLPGSGIYLPTKLDAATVYNVPLIRFGEYNDFCDEYELIRFKGGR
jgi:hypothetical protein